jgi:low temperature requirement protein LtrA
MNAMQRLVREPQEPRRIVYLELFFDLAFLLAFTRLSGNLLEHPDLSGAFHTVVLLAALFWVWSATTWAADWYDPNHRVVQGIIVGSMLGALLMAATIPEAFGAYALVFASANVAVHLGRGLVLLAVLRADPTELRSARILVWAAVTGVLWIVGGALPALRTPLWTVAVVVDFAVARIRWPVPGLGRTSREAARAEGSRLAERLQQIFIISVGELILAAGIRYSDIGLGWATTTAFVLTFIHAALLALIYYAPAGRQLGSAIDTSEYPASVGQEASYLHLALIAGVIGTVVGDELLIGHADRPARMSTVLFAIAGTALFLVARIVLSALTYRRLSLARLAGLVAIVALAPAAFHLPSFAVVAVTDVVLLVTAGSDFLIERRVRRGQATRG